MAINKSQRVGVFVDVQNLYHSAKNLYDTKVDFTRILQEVVKDRKLVRAIAYVISTEGMKEQNFFETLENIGFEVKAKDLQIFFGGAKKGDWDVGIAMDIIELTPKLDVVILLSGDGDFVPLMQHAKYHGCYVEAAAFGKSTSSLLKETVDKFTDFDKSPEKYLISKPKVNRGHEQMGRDKRQQEQRRHHNPRENTKRK